MRAHRSASLVGRVATIGTSSAAVGLGLTASGAVLRGVATGAGRVAGAVWTAGDAAGAGADVGAGAGASVGAGAGGATGAGAGAAESVLICATNTGWPTATVSAATTGVCASTAWLKIAYAKRLQRTSVALRRVLRSLTAERWVIGPDVGAHAACEEKSGVWWQAVFIETGFSIGEWR